jgi:hypothetical protein
LIERGREMRNLIESKNLIEIAEQVYQQHDYTPYEFRYEVIKSRYSDSVGAFVNNLVVDGYMTGDIKTLILNKDGKTYIGNFI